MLASVAVKLGDNFVVSSFEFSSPPSRSLRLSGELDATMIHCRDPEAAEITQRKTETRTLPVTSVS